MSVQNIVDVVCDNALRVTIVLSDLRSFTKLAAGTAMMFILEKQNDDFMTGKLNILRPSLKAIIYQLSLIILLPRATTSNGIILTF